MPEATTRIRVRFADVDSSQRIHYTAMFRYMEAAEHELMRSLGVPYSATLWDTAMPRVHLDCDFRGAVIYDDEVDVTARVAHVGTSSWTIAFMVRRASSPRADAEIGAVVAEGHMTIVSMNPTTERARPIPEQLRTALMAD